MPKRSANPTDPAQRVRAYASWTVWCVIAYFAIQLGLRLVISSNLEVDDAEMVGQIGWAWGYSHSHPPLFHWLVRLCYDLFGSWVAATATSKYVLLATTFLLLYDTGRRASGSAVVGAVAVAFLFLVPAIFWKTQGRLTHSIVGLTATAAMLHALVLVLVRPRAWTFAWLGLALSAGLLAKYNFLLVAGALAITVVCLPDARRGFKCRAAFLAIALPLLLTAPHWLWIRSHPGVATQSLYRLRMTGGPLGLKLPANSVWDGLVSLLLVTLVSLTPMLIVYFAARFTRNRKVDSVARESNSAPNIRRFLGWLALVELGLFIAAVFFGKLSQVHERYLIVLLPPFPLWLALRWHSVRQPSAVVILPIAGLLAVAITIVRPLSIMEDHSRLAFPYAEIAAKIAPSVRAPVEILADRPENAANIAMRLPGAAVCDGRPRTVRVLVVADDPATASALGRELKENYEPVGAVLVIERPWRWKSNRLASLAVQRWQRRDEIR